MPTLLEMLGPQLIVNNMQSTCM